MRFAVLHNCTPLPFSPLVVSPLALSPHHLLSTLQLSMFSTFPSLLCGFLCQPFLPSNFYWLTNAVRWSWLASTLHKQPACSHHDPLKHHSSTVIHVCMKWNMQQCWTSSTHVQRYNMVICALIIHTNWRTRHLNKCLCFDMEDPSVEFAGAMLIKSSSAVM